MAAPSSNGQDAAYADVHELAAEAGAIEADIEKFLDESLIGDINSAADAQELDASLADRREQRAAKARVAERAAELLAAELVCKILPLAPRSASRAGDAATRAADASLPSRARRPSSAMRRRCAS